MDSQRQPRQRPEQVVAPADVGALVEQDVVPLPLGQAGGQVDPGPGQPPHKGGGDVVGQPDVFLPLQREGRGQPPS